MEKRGPAPSQTDVATTSRGKAATAKRAPKAKKKGLPKINPKQVDHSLFYNDDCFDKYIKFSKAAVNRVHVFKNGRKPNSNIEIFLQPFKSSHIDKLLCLDLPSPIEEVRQFYANLTQVAEGGMKTMVHKHEFPVDKGTINAAFGCPFTSETENVMRVTYGVDNWPKGDLQDRMRSLFGNPTRDLSSPNLTLARSLMWWIRCTMSLL